MGAPQLFAHPLGRALAVLLLTCIGAHGATESQNTTLKISTHPPGAEVFLGKAPTRGQLPLGSTPSRFILPDTTQHIWVYLYKPEMRDTAIDLRLHPGKDNYLSLRLRPQFDSLALQAQQKFENQRAWRQRGKRLLQISLLPLGFTGYYGVRMLQEYNAAEQRRQDLNASLIRSGERWDHNTAAFETARAAGNHHRTRAQGWAAATLLLAGIGGFLHF